jgi:hypothetical protein
MATAVDDMGASPVTLMPDWVAEVLSPGTVATDRGVKTEACRTMGVAGDPFGPEPVPVAEILA